MADLSIKDCRDIVRVAVEIARGDGNESALRYLEQAAKTLRPLKARTATGRSIDSRPVDRSCPTCETEYRLALTTAFLFAVQGRLDVPDETPILTLECECGEVLMIRADEVGL